MAYTNAIFYIDLENGNDAVRATLTGAIASNPTGTTVRITYAGHGLVTGAVVTLSSFTYYLNGAWKITKVDDNSFDLDDAVWATTADPTGNVVPFGGSSWDDAWLTTAYGPTSARINPGDVVRINKTPDPVSIGNATWNNDERVITLAAARTATIIKEGTWVAATGGDVSNIIYGNGYASTSSQVTIYLDSAIQTSKKQAYCTISELDLSAYQEISFIIKVTNNITVAALKIVLCSDTAGDTIVDTFTLPIVASGYATVFTLPPDIGGNLGSSIKSVAIYTTALATSALLGSKRITMDMVIATKTNDLSFTTLISKNSAGQGGDEAFYMLSMIDGVNCLIGSVNFYYSTGGYYPGETETVETYLRVGFVIPSFVGNIKINQTNKNGTADKPISFLFGFNKLTNICDGETFVINAQMLGYGFYASHAYTVIDKFNPFNFSMGVYLAGSNLSILTIQSANCNAYGIYSNGSFNSIGIIKNANFNNNGITIIGDSITLQEISTMYTCTSNGITFGSSSVNSNYKIGKLDKIGRADNIMIGFQNIVFATIDEIVEAKNCDGSGIFLNGVANIHFKKIGTMSGNTNYDINITNIAENVLFENVESIGTLQNTFGTIFFKNINSLPTITQYGTSKVESSVNIINQDGTKQIVGRGIDVNFDVTTKRLITDFGSWKFYINYIRSIDYPYELKIAEYAFIQDKQVTITAWLLVEEGVTARIFIKESKLIGILSDVESVVDTDVTDWQQITLSFVPTHSGVHELFVEFATTGGATKTGFLGEISISQES